MNIENIKAILFDNDGVLIDSITPDFMSYEALCLAHDIPVDKQEWFKIASGNIQGYNILLGKLPMSLTEAKQALEYQWELFLTEEHVTLMPGVHNILNYIQKKKLPLAVVTAASYEWADRWLNHFEIHSYFDFIVSGEGCHNNKPHPDPYLKAAHKIGVEPSECLVFEDSYPGMTAAKEAGMNVVAVTQYYADHMAHVSDIHFSTFMDAMNYFHRVK